MNSNTPGTTTNWPASPCIGVCELDETEGLCSGCGRTVAEISNWLELSADARTAVFEQLADRLKRVKEKQERGQPAESD